MLGLKPPGPSVEIWMLQEGVDLETLLLKPIWFFVPDDHRAGFSCTGSGIIINRAGLERTPGLLRF